MRSIAGLYRRNRLVAVGLLPGLGLVGRALAEPPETVTVEAQREQNNLSS